MVHSTSQLSTVDEFIVRYGDDARYELIDGELINMEPTGSHEQVAAFVGRKLNSGERSSRSPLLHTPSLSRQALRNRHSVSPRSKNEELFQSCQ